MSEELKNTTEETAGGCGCGSGCGCGHGHDHDHGHNHYETITLTMEGDEEVPCSVLGIFDVEEQEYIALLPEGGEDVYIYEYHEEESGLRLENIETQEDFDKVSAVFLEIIESENEEA